MSAVLWKIGRRVVAFFKRLVADKPQNEYERILFGAAYSMGLHIRRGLAG